MPNRVILRVMAKQHPPNPAGETTGFPYQRFWEELEPDWENFRLDPAEFTQLQGHFVFARAWGAPPHLCIEQEEVEALLLPLQLDVPTQERLSLHLYWLAGIYLGREHRKFLNMGPQHVRNHLQNVSKASKRLNGALSLLIPEATALLRVLRPIVPGTVRPGETFDLAEMLDVSRRTSQCREECICDRSARGGVIG